MSDPKELISVYKGENVTEAHLLMNLLLDEDIQAFVSEENEPFSGLTIVAPDVLVSRQDEIRARSIIERYDNMQSARATRPDWKCPSCGVKVLGALDECDACGAARPGSDEEGEESADDE